MPYVELDSVAFMSFLNAVKAAYGEDVELIILPNEMEDLIFNAFMHGKLNTVVTHDTDKSGSIKTFLNGIKTKFTPKLTFGRAMFLLKGHKTLTPNGPNPVFPKTDGPPTNGGAPIGVAA
jgi:hypothetical protein